MTGQVIIVSGTSGSGKSTACERFVQEADGFWLLHGIDHFLAGTFPAAYGHHGPNCDEGIRAQPRDPAAPDGDLRWSLGDHGLRAFGVFHEWIAAAAREGCNIIADHLLMRDPPLLGDLVRRLEGVPVLLVALRPPYAVLERRVAERAMTRKLPVELLGEDAAAKIVDRLGRLRPWFYEAVGAGIPADLEIDTDVHDPAAVCALIRARLAQGPGSAIEALRREFGGRPPR